jgi:serine protease AprX
VASPPDLERWIFGPEEERRYTQDSPVLPDVWLAFGEEPGQRHDLLLTPHQHSTAARLAREVLDCLERDFGQGEASAAEVALNEGYVVARLTLGQLARCVVPRSSWWREAWQPRAKQAKGMEPRPSRGAMEWYRALLGRISVGGESGEWASPRAREEQARHGAELLTGLQRPRKGERADLWRVSLNRQARTALSKSRLAVKADAAERVFSVKCSDLRWAIVDTGIDATHPAFRRRTASGALEGSRWKTRVLATYDFTRLRGIVSGESGGLDREQRRDLLHRIETAQAIDWDALKPLLGIPHGPGYVVPELDHGTHVAGIVGADWRAGDKGMPARNDLVGICPDIELYDLRVFGGPGGGDEFAITGALQFIRHLNSHSDLQVVHGANLSLSLDHDLANYAVGRTPICDECERLMAVGVMVVAAAGNEGQAKFVDGEGHQQDRFRTVAITDPGNAEGIVTVGSTHRQDPHTYGVSYFSSKGPTGDGREKPDLVAPGEKISAPTPGGDYKGKDGTSQATAHVSGVAALLMARHPELVAQPAEVKRILCRTATDLGRRREFQGSGLVDALRALQAV